MQDLRNVISDRLPSRPGQTQARLAVLTNLIPYRLFFALYGVFAVAFYFLRVEPYLASADLFAPRLLADAITYEAICVAEANFLDWNSLRDIGPCVGLRLFGYDSGLLSIFNAVMIVGSTLWLAKVYARPWRPLLALILLNPITFLSIFGPNKEAFGLTSVIMLASFVKSRSVASLTICLIAALFTRISLAIVSLAYCVMLVSALPHTRHLAVSVIRRYYLILISMIVVMSILAAIFSTELQYSLLGDISRAEDISQSTRISLSFDYLTEYGLYAVLYLVRMILNIYSAIVGLINIDSRDGNIYYNVGVVGSSIAFAIVSGIIAFSRISDDLKKTSDGWNIILFIVLFTLVICVSPIVQHRYFYPLYALLLLFIVKQREALEIADPASAPTPAQRVDPDYPSAR